MTTPPQQMSPGEPFQDSAADQSLDDLLASSQFANFDFASSDFVNPFTAIGNDSAFDPTATVSPLDLTNTANFGQFNDFAPSGLAIPEEMTPMQPPMPQQFPRGPPGASYHPAVGWHYPAPLNPNVLQQILASYGMSAPPQVRPFGNIGMEPEQQMQPRKVATGRKRKEYYGPDNYFKGNSPDDGESSNPSSSSNSNEQRPRKRAKPSSPQPNVVQSCVCDSRGAKIPRPRNAFILFRSHRVQELRSKDKAGSFNQQKLSEAAGSEWKAAPDAVRNKFFALAEEEKKKHAQMYPGYVYQPGAHKLNEFGNEECTCGAYQANMAALNKEDAVEEIAAPSQTSATPYPPPTVMPDFGLPTPAQNAQAAAIFADMQAKQSAPAPAPAPIRRSARNRETVVSYADSPESGDDELETQSSSAPTSPNTENANGKSPRPTDISTATPSTPLDLPSAGLDLPDVPPLTDFDLFRRCGLLCLDR